MDLANLIRVLDSRLTDHFQRIDLLTLAATSSSIRSALANATISRCISLSTYKLDEVRRVTGTVPGLRSVRIRLHDPMDDLPRLLHHFRKQSVRHVSRVTLVNSYAQPDLVGHLINSYLTNSQVTNQSLRSQPNGSYTYNWNEWPFQKCHTLCCVSFVGMISILLKGFPSLTALTLNHCSHIDLTHLASPKRIRSLKINRSDFQWRSLSVLKEMSGLRTLKLSHVGPVFPSDTATRWPRLERVSLVGRVACHMTTALLGNCPHLASLSLAHVDPYWAPEQSASGGFPCLRHLKLKSGSTLHSSLFRFLVTQFPRLETLQLSLLFDSHWASKLNLRGTNATRFATSESEWERIERSTRLAPTTRVTLRLNFDSYHRIGDENDETSNLSTYFRLVCLIGQLFGRKCRDISLVVSLRADQIPLLISAIQTHLKGNIVNIIHGDSNLSNRRDQNTRISTTLEILRKHSCQSACSVNIGQERRNMGEKLGLIFDLCKPCNIKLL